MRKVIFLLFVGLLGWGIWTPVSVEAAPRTRTYLEEEQKQERRQSLNKNIVCGVTGRQLRVGGFVTNPPFGWVNVSQNEWRSFYTNDGFSFQLFEKLADKLGVTVKNVGFPSFAEAVLALRKGEIDVLAGAYYDRHVLGVGTKLMFPGYFKNQIIVVFPKGKERTVRSYADLKGQRGVVRQEELIYSLIYQQTKGLSIEQVFGARKAYTMLLKGEADYLITSLYAAEAETRRFKLIDNLVFTDYALIQPELFFVFSANSPCTRMMPLFAKALEEEQQNQTAYFNYFLTFLDAWGNRFRNEPSLIEQLQEQPTTPTELVEPTAQAKIDDTPNKLIDVSNGTPVPPPTE